MIYKYIISIKYKNEDQQTAIEAEMESFLDDLIKMSHFYEIGVDVEKQIVETMQLKLPIDDLRGGDSDEGTN